MRGSCACGAVTVETARTPDPVLFCDCTLCRKLGAAWGYFQPGEVTVSGPTATYHRAKDSPTCVVHRCVDCGATTHWVRPEGAPADMVGVNARLFEESELAGAQAHFPDGRNWDGNWPPSWRSEPVRFGERPLP